MPGSLRKGGALVYDERVILAPFPEHLLHGGSPAGGIFFR